MAAFTFVPSDAPNEKTLVSGSTKTNAARQAAISARGYRVASHKVWVTSADEVVIETAYGSVVIGMLIPFHN